MMENRYGNKWEWRKKKGAWLGGWAWELYTGVPTFSVFVRLNSVPLHDCETGKFTGNGWSVVFPDDGESIGLDHGEWTSTKLDAIKAHCEKIAAVFDAFFDDLDVVVE